MSMAISWMLTPLFYPLRTPVDRPASKREPLKYHRFMPSIAFLECPFCSTPAAAAMPQTVCPQCAGDLFLRYDMEDLRSAGKSDQSAAKALAAYNHLVAKGLLTPGDQVVIVDSGSQLNYADKTTAASHSPGVPETIPEPEPEKDHRGITLPSRHRAGGIITPQ
jgi:hypothetical protein